MILAAESHGEHGEAKHDVAADGAEAYDVVEDHNEVATQGATTLLLLLLVDAHNEHEDMEMLIHLIARLLVMM
jgi:hypothetical protein